MTLEDIINVLTVSQILILFKQNSLETQEQYILCNKAARRKLLTNRYILTSEESEALNQLEDTVNLISNGMYLLFYFFVLYFISKYQLFYYIVISPTNDLLNQSNESTIQTTEVDQTMELDMSGILLLNRRIFILSDINIILIYIYVWFVGLHMENWSQELIYSKPRPAVNNLETIRLADLSDGSFVFCEEEEVTDRRETTAWRMNDYDIDGTLHNDLKLL